MTIEMKKEEAADSVVLERLRIIESVEKHGNIRDACRQAGIDRSRFYEWRRRYRAQGMEGLKDRPPVHRSHPQTTPDTVVRMVLDLALEHPEWGCGRLAGFLRSEGVSISSPTVQAVLVRNGIGSRCQRLMKIVERVAAENRTDAADDLSAEQIRSLEKVYL